VRVVVADTGPLIIFGRSCGIEIISAVAKEILVPPTVLSECIADTGKPGAVAIRAAVETGLLTRLPSIDLSGITKGLSVLDPGEMEAIAAAKIHQCPVLMDEIIGRTVARRIGLQVAGSLGILLMAKRLGAIDKVGPIISDWKAAKYHLSDALVTEVLSRAGETKTPAP